MYETFAYGKKRRRAGYDQFSGFDLSRVRRALDRNMVLDDETSDQSL
jgi:hypothetical protein